MYRGQDENCALNFLALSALSICCRACRPVLTGECTYIDVRANAQFIMRLTLRKAILYNDM